MSEQLKEDKILQVLNNQNTLLKSLVGQVRSLADLPAQVSVVETKLTFMASVHQEIHTMNTDLNRVGTKVSNHSLVLAIVGAVILTGMPILAAWNYNLRSELTELQRATAQLEARINNERPSRP